MKNKDTKQKREEVNETWVTLDKYVNRWGQLMVAADYGYPYWRFKINNRRK